MRPNRSLSGGISLSLASLLALSSTAGCSKIEELTGGKKEEEAKAAEPAITKDAKQEEAKAVEPVVAVDAEVAPVEPIPVEEMATGLDLMLELVPEGAEFIIARDATVVAEYVEEATRFVDGPLATLKAGPFAAEAGNDLEEAVTMLAEVRSKTDAIKLAIESSGIELKEGAVIAKAKGGDAYLIFKAADPNALVAVGKATGEADFNDLKCKAIEGVPGYNVCADSQAEVDAYKSASDTAPVRAQLAENLPGVDLDAANVLAHIEPGSTDEIYMAVTTIPGQVYMAVNMPSNKDELAEMRKSIQAGPAKTLAQVQPGSGFLWAHVNPELLTASMRESGNPMADTLGKSLTGEFVIAGSVDPGGLIIQAGTSDAAGLETLMTTAFAETKEGLPKEIPEMPAAKLTFEQVPVEGGGKTAQALHVGVTGLAEADVLKSFTGLHLDAWMFAANDSFTMALGPDKGNVGKLLDMGATGGISTATLDTLPPQLAEGLGRNEVGMIVHMPMDFLHGAQLQSLARSALKDLPMVPPEQVIAVAGLFAPLSSGTMWVAMPGDKMVIHFAAQGIGNRATEEGRAALDAAHTVADGGDPAVAFASLASTYAGSPMAWAYKTRAGTDGPGYMVGSGLGAVLAVTAVAVPLALGASNAALAEDLGVKPEDPEPELVPVTTPKRPVTKKTPKADPKTDPAKPKEDPKEPDPIVEPTRPLPPKPEPTPTGRKPKIGKGRKN